MSIIKLLLIFLLAIPLYGQSLDQKIFAEVFKKVKDSVVSIKISTTVVEDGQPKTVEGGGSGIIVSSDGLIITNKHVINDTTRSFKVILSDGQELAASFVGMAPDTDLSVIKLNSVPTSGAKPIVLGDSDKIEVGNLVLVIGSPFGLGGTLTVGVISAKERPIPIPNVNGQVQPHTLIQTDAAINPGNSGGVLVDLNGELIGVPTMLLSETGTNAGIGFAIPVNVVKRVLQDITNRKTTVGWLGILAQDVSGLSPTIRQQLGVNVQRGVIVTSFEPDSPAEKSGIKQYDAILSINGQAINNVKDLEWAVRNLSPGEVAVLKIQPRGSLGAQEVKITVGKPTK